MANPVMKMMTRMMTMERQVEVIAALSSSSLFCLEISLEICFSRMEGFVLVILELRCCQNVRRRVMKTYQNMEEAADMRLQEAVFV